MAKISDKLVSYIAERSKTASIKVETGTSILSIQIPPPNQLLSDFCDVGDLMGVIGKSKTRKSWFLAQLAISLASGTDFLDFTVRRKHRVMLVQLEVQRDHYNRRLQMISDGMFGSHEFLDDMVDNLLVVHGRGQDIDSDKLVVLAKQYQPEVMVVDPLYLLMEEQDSESHKHLISQFYKIMESNNRVSIIYAHHDKKGTSGDLDLVDRGAGHSTLGRAYDCSIVIDPHADNDQYQVLQAICRNYPPRSDMTVEWVGGKFNMSDNVVPRVETSYSRNSRNSRCAPASEYTEMALEYVKDGLSKTVVCENLREGLGVSRRQAVRIVDTMVEDGTLRVDTGERNSRVLYFAEIGERNDELPNPFG